MTIVSKEKAHHIENLPPCHVVVFSRMSTANVAKRKKYIILKISLVVMGFFQNVNCKCCGQMKVDLKCQPLMWLNKIVRYRFCRSDIQSYITVATSNRSSNGGTSIMHCMLHRNWIDQIVCLIFNARSRTFRWQIYWVPFTTKMSFQQYVIVSEIIYECQVWCMLPLFGLYNRVLLFHYK